MITIVTCRYCGKAGLIWKKDKYGVWVLTENGVQKHVCKKTKNKRSNK